MWFLLVACSQLTDLDRSGPSPARAFRTLTVDCEGSTPFVTIDAALEAANSGDVVRVLPCTYEGTVRFRGKSVTLESTAGPESTVLVATPGEPVVKVKDGEGAGTMVSGFTLTGGGAFDQPAIEVQFSSLVLRDSLVTGNAGTAVLYSHAGHVLVERSTFRDNAASEHLVVNERRGMTVLKDTTVHCGAGDTGYLVEHGAGFVDGSTFHCAGGVAVELYHADGRVQRSVVDGSVRIENEVLDLYERAVLEGVVLRGDLAIEAADVTLRNVVSLGGITATDARVAIHGSILTGAPCAVTAVTSSVAVASSDLWANTQDRCGDVAAITLTDVVAFDPRFVDAVGGDFRLAPGSPCVDAGPLDPDHRDPDGSRNDLGAYGGPLSLGGGW